MDSRSRHWLWKINKCFLGFKADPDWNIQLITSCCGELMGAGCALYNRLSDGILYSAAQWNTPQDFNPVDRPDGHICHDVIKKGGRKVFVLRDLHRSVYAGSDPNVSAYGLKTYIGTPVNCRDHSVGSLCVVYLHDYAPSEEDKKMLQVLASALGVEEERRLAANALREANDQLEIRVEERTAELDRVNERLRVDIIERKRAETEIMRMNEELKERTRQLLDTQEELIRREKMAMLGRLAGSVGHELRNPLGVINNAVYYLKSVMPDADGNVKEYLEIIKCEVDNSTRIITDLLHFGSAGAPRPQTSFVSELINRSLAQYKIPENIKVSVEAPESLPPLDVDPSQVVRIFSNLVTNAVQAMPDGGTLDIFAGTVRFSGAKNIKRGESCGGTADEFMEISFADTGEGISAENMKEIFQPLFTTRPRGTGLGLAICGSLAEANGGALSVESRPGEGAKFTVSFPVKSEAKDRAGAGRDRNGEERAT